MDIYSLKWNSQSQNSGESMPLSGRDLGANVWVENNELFLYLAQSGAFDQQGQMLKAGRLRLHFDCNPFVQHFLQELHLKTGEITVSGDSIQIRIWADREHSTVRIRITAPEKLRITCSYELWRKQDTVTLNDGQILFFHRNTGSDLLEERLSEQGIQHLRPWFPDVEKNRTTGGVLLADGMEASGCGSGEYLGHAFTAYCLETPSPVLEQELLVCLHTAQTPTADEWEKQVLENVQKALADKQAEEANRKWWEQFWDRSYVWVKPQCTDPSDIDWQVGRNYQLFRYMQASNAEGEFPTKFNGGLFTVDPCAFVPSMDQDPDWRDWGGIMFTAQNQRLVYWPMIKNGDFDMMKPEFEFYRRLVTPIQKRTEHFFGLKDAACFCEQIDANGLSSHYGKYGVDYPLQVRHHYVQALEFCYMIILYHETSGEDISDYMEFILSVLHFYDQKYCKLDERGKRVIFPSTAMETYHASPLTEIYGKEGVEAANYCEEETAVTNPADVIAALLNSMEALLETNYLSEKEREKLQRFHDELPPIPVEEKNGHQVIAPCEFPKKYYKGNCEIPQLNTVYPYHIYGLNLPDLQLARDTYFYGWEEEDQLLHVSWHVNGVYAARLGLTEEAVKYMHLKLGDSGRRFPAFWGPGHDYTPDHNWGGSGMIGVQEMLMQCRGDKIYLFGAWDKSCDVSFKLHAPKNTVVECSLQSGEITSLRVFPADRQKDIVVL